MNIIAESKPVAAVPFVHLGYLAASYFRPLGGWPLTGCILLVAFLGTVLSRRKSKIGAIGKRFLLYGTGCFVVASMFSGGKSYPHGDKVTSISMERALKCIEMKATNTPDEYRSNPIRTLPTKPGVYDLAEAVQDGEEASDFRDGWRTPMKLKVTITEEQKIDYLLMSAGKDGKWNTDDDFTSLKYAKRWEANRAGYGNPETQETATPSAETTSDSRESGQEE